jgi:hypothetical protein
MGGFLIPLHFCDTPASIRVYAYIFFVWNQYIGKNIKCDGKTMSPTNRFEAYLRDKNHGI